MTTARACSQDGTATAERAGVALTRPRTGVEDREKVVQGAAVLREPDALQKFACKVAAPPTPPVTGVGVPLEVSVGEVQGAMQRYPHSWAGNSMPGGPACRW